LKNNKKKIKKDEVMVATYLCMKNLVGASPKASYLWHYHLPPTHENAFAAVVGYSQAPSE